VHIRVIAPLLNSPELVEKARREYQSGAAPGTIVSVVAVALGTTTIENEFDAALAAPEVMRLVRDAEAEGLDACIIASFGDPVVVGARDLVSIPVIGEGEAALEAAAVLGLRFSIIITEKNIFPFVRRLVDRQGLRSRLASVRVAGART
jgi:allantoin racemase